MSRSPFFVSSPGYIAGVTNPIFEQRNTWWDLLCNISNGDVTLSPAYQEEINQATLSAGGNSPDSGSKLPSLDSIFFQQLMCGVQSRYGEEWCRCMFRDLTDHFLHLLTDEEQFVFDDAAESHKALHVAAYSYRMRAFVQSSQAARWRSSKDALAKVGGSAFGPLDPLIRKHVRALQLGATASNLSLPRNTKSLSPKEMLFIYTTFLNHIHTREEVLELLAMLYESRGGFMPIAVALLNQEEKVRNAVIDIMQRIDAEPEGNKAISSLNYFLLMTYYRYVKKAGKQLQDVRTEGQHPNRVCVFDGLTHSIRVCVCLSYVHVCCFSFLPMTTAMIWFRPTSSASVVVRPMAV